MNNFRKIILCVLFFHCLHSLSALDVQITGKELGFDVTTEYNRSLIFCGSTAVSGALKINNHHTVKGGFILGALGDTFEMTIFSSAHYTPLLSEQRLGISLAYAYNGLPGPAYNIHSHALLPYVSFNGRRAGFSLGTNLRFTRFFGEQAIFEPMLSFSGYVNIINNEKIRIGIISANFDDYLMGNMGAYFLRLNGIVHITQQWYITSEITLMQSGSVALSSTFYGIAYRGGVRFRW